MKCKNCKFWNAKKLEDYEIKSGRTQHGDCSSEKFTYNCDGNRQSDGLEYWDYESYSAGFSTGPDFGCVNFEPSKITKESKQ